MYTNIDTDYVLPIISEYVQDEMAQQKFKHYDVEALIKSLKIVMRNSVFLASDLFTRMISGITMDTPPPPICISL